MRDLQKKMHLPSLADLICSLKIFSSSSIYFPLMFFSNDYLVMLVHNSTTSARVRKNNCVGITAASVRNIQNISIGITTASVKNIQTPSQQQSGLGIGCNLHSNKLGIQQSSSRNIHPDEASWNIRPSLSTIEITQDVYHRHHHRMPQLELKSPWKRPPLNQQFQDAWS